MRDNTSHTTGIPVRLNDLGRQTLGSLSPRTERGLAIEVSKIDPRVVVILIPEYTSRERRYVKIHSKFLEPDHQVSSLRK